MIIPRIALVALLAVAPLSAQDAAPGPAAPPPEVPKELVLRGIDRVFLDVALTEGARPEDADLRADLRDVMELELRRAGMLLRESSVNESGASRAPGLRLEVKFDRGAGRFAARLNLAVRDQVTVTRNRAVLLAEIWTQERGVSSAVDTGLARELRQRTREMTLDFISALRKANGAR